MEGIKLNDIRRVEQVLFPQWSKSVMIFRLKLDSLLIMTVSYLMVCYIVGTSYSYTPSEQSFDIIYFY